MTTILPAERGPWDVISKSLGQSLENSLPQDIQRRQGLDAVSQLQQQLAQSGGDMTKMLPALMRAYTLNPSLERSGLGQKAMEMAEAGKFPGALETGAAENVPQPAPIVDPSLIVPIAEETDQPQPATAEGKKTPHDIDSIANQYIGEVRPDLVNPATQYGAISTFDSAVKQDLSPQEESQLRQQLMDKYKNPNIVNQVVDRIREGVRNKFNEAQATYGFDKDRQQQIRDKWNSFVNGNGQPGTGTNARLAPHLDKFGEGFPKTKEVLQNKYNQYAGSLPINMTPEQMHTNAMALLQNDINKMDALHALPSMPPVRNEKDVKDYIESNKKAYKDLADSGFIDALKEDAILNKDMGIEEFHSMIWGDQTSKHLLNDIHSLKAPQEYSPSGIAHAPQKYNKNYPQEHEKYINELSTKLKKLSPNDDLMLARAMVLDQGGNVKDFIDALGEAQNKGLKLSEFQKSQIQEIHQPRKPPIHEFFNEGGPTMNVPFLGEAKFFNWGPFINYVRGKR